MCFVDSATPRRCQTADMVVAWRSCFNKNCIKLSTTNYMVLHIAVIADDLCVCNKCWPDPPRAGPWCCNLYAVVRDSSFSSSL